MSEQLEEFQYNYGDPRPHLIRYFEKFPNMALAVPARRKNKTTLLKMDCFHFKCDKADKRTLTPPKNVAKFLSIVADAQSPLLIIPVYLTNKLGCRFADGSKHLMFLLYNRLTKEVERIDIRKYHLDGFTLKLFVKKMDDAFIDKFLPGASYIPEVDVPLSFMKKHGFVTAAQAFPLYLLSYIDVRSNDPSLTASKARSMAAVLGKKKVKEIWNKYVEYKNSIPSKCQVGKLENLSTGACVAPLSKSLQKYIIAKKPKPCKLHKTFSPLLSKCVTSNRLADVNVLLEDVLKVKVSDNEVLKNLDKDPVIAIGIMNYILSKYPHGRFVAPMSLDKVKKSDFKITWKFDKNVTDFVLTIPTQFWDIWKQHMFDASCRFIIAFVGLVSKPKGNMTSGFHANVLIYDKTNNELERFDGLGRHIHALYNIDGFDKQIIDVFNGQKDIFPKPLKYYTPLDYCPKMPIFQMKEINEIPGIDLSGNCAVWRVYYVNLRLANPQLNRKDLVVMASNKLSDTGSLYKFIKSYQKYLLNSYEALKNSS